ncbi:MAG: hypothetical protein LBQ81_02715 [Zoogloeaceae bacterium]|nr:hypothetical protein [Zoogloeaceae bacterium]
MPYFENWAAFLASGLEPSGFFLEDCAGQTLENLLRAIRRSRWWAAPVVGSETTATDDACWLDARQALAQAREFAAVMAQRQRNMPAAGELHTLDERLLYFLYARGVQAVLKPVGDRSNLRLYRYPVAELLAKDNENATQMLDDLVRRGLLEAVTLLDRTRHCRKCDSAHLHFLDVCPRCGGIDIHKSPALHCFACGHIAPEADFLSQSTLTCPKCKVGLRHIGVDYDRPLTQYACHACRHVFMEGDVVARCLDCGQTVQPSELHVREISTLALTARGRTAVRAGEIHETFVALDSGRYVEPAFFRRMLDWMLATRVRHPEFRFTLMLLEFVNAEAMVSELGGMRLYMLLNEFAHRILELLRTSDITSRTHETNLWFLLPYSSAPGLASRLQNLFDELTSHWTTTRFETRIRHVDVPGSGRIDVGMQAQELMRQLEGDGD